MRIGRMRMGWPRSLFGQIVLFHVLTILVAALTLPLAVSLILRRTAAHYQDELLTRQAVTVAQGLSRDPGGGWRVRLGPALNVLYAHGYDGRAYAVLDARGAALLVSAPPGRPTLAAAPRARRPAFFKAGSIDALSVPVERAGQRLWVVVSQDINDPEVVTDDIVSAFLARFLLVLLPILALLPLINAALIRRSTDAVHRVSRRAADIGPATLKVRLPSAELPSEVAPLADATNNALDRLEEGFRAQSEFVANVAHEMRTPLALLRLQIDGIDDPVLAAGLRGTLDRASHVVSQLLDLASLERISIREGERFDLAGLAREAVEATAPAIFEGGRTIGLSGGDRPVRVVGRAPLVSLALVNLIDNAARHTPAGTHVEVAVHGDGRVTVEDDGPGVARTDIASLTMRFWRADHARSDSAGIGLSIVERILAAHRTVLEVANRAGGGARFGFTLRVDDAPGARE